MEIRAGETCTKSCICFRWRVILVYNSISSSSCRKLLFVLREGNVLDVLKGDRYSMIL